MEAKLFDGVFGSRRIEVELLKKLEGFPRGTNSDFEFQVHVLVLLS